MSVLSSYREIVGFGIMLLELVVSVSKVAVKSYDFGILLVVFFQCSAYRSQFSTQ